MARARINAGIDDRNVVNMHLLTKVFRPPGMQPPVSENQSDTGSYTNGELVSRASVVTHMGASLQGPSSATRS